jgi:hypothetical protein
MNLKNQPPIFVPAQYRAEIEQLSKAALMDMVWDYATQLAMTPTNDETAMDEFRQRRDIILTHRNNAKAA